MREQSIDIETLSTQTDAAVIAIGVQEFDIDTGQLGRTFHRSIVFDSAIKAGRVDGPTLQWWAHQKNQHTYFVSDPREADKSGMATALDELATYMRGTLTKNGAGVPIVWARGLHFDIAVLEWHYRHSAVGLAIPWHRANCHEQRTLIELAHRLVGFDASTVKRDTEPHNALHDATHQARVIIAAWKAIKAVMGDKVAKEYRDDVKNPAIIERPKEPPKKNKGLRYWSHPESDSMFSRPFDELPTDPLCVEVSIEAFRKWNSEQDL